MEGFTLITLAAAGQNSVQKILTAQGQKLGGNVYVAWM